ncbi:MAG: hypothetical protein ACOYL6_10345 [Bacteriovoracaceae bacterium]
MRSMLITILFVLFAFGAFANESETFTFNGSETFKEVVLRSQVYRTEYRTETHNTTCYRQELAGYRPQCHYETRQNCYYVPRTCHIVTSQQCTSVPPVCRPVCHNGPQGQICKNVCSGGGTQCRPVNHQQCNGGYNQCNPYQYQVCVDVPVYRTVPYACTETVQVPYQVFDHTVDANVKLNFAELPQGANANEKFTVAIQKDDIVISVASSKNVLIYTEKTQNVSVNGANKIIDANIRARFSNLASLRETLTSISQVKIENNVLAFAIGKASNLQFKQKLKIVQKKLFKDKTLIDRELASFEVSSFASNGQQYFSVDLKKLGLNLKEKKHIVTLSTEAILDNARPLNYQDLPVLKLSKEVEIKL